MLLQTFVSLHLGWLQGKVFSCCKCFYFTNQPGLDHDHYWTAHPRWEKQTQSTHFSPQGQVGFLTGALPLHRICQVIAQAVVKGV